MQLDIETAEIDKVNSKNSGFIDYLREVDAEDVSDMLGSRAIPSFLQTVWRHGLKEFSGYAIKLWIADMLINGLKGSTVRRYTGALHSLFRTWRETLGDDSDQDDDAFSISPDIYGYNGTGKRQEETERNLQALESMTKTSVKSDSPAYVFSKAFQYLLFNPETTLKDIVSLKYSDPIPDSPHLEDIVTSMRKAPQAKYVFPLQQGKRREPAIIKDLLSELHATGRRAGIYFGDSFSRESITSLWISVAVKEDIPYEEILGVIRNLPRSHAFLSILPAAELSDERKTEILNTVAYSITNKTPGWFVLRLRSGVTPDRIKERLKEKESPLQRQIQYYYPLRSVKKMEKKKVITVETPVIPGILFFRLPYDRVAPLIGVIGDMAWCYRSSANASSPYSVIPQNEMRLFQRTVGAFTSDVEMDIVSALPPLNVGDEVLIEDGSMLDGRLATIRKVRSVDGTLTYTLRLSDTEFIRWKDVSLPASHLSKVGN